jgi:hypothetical protein
MSARLRHLPSVCVFLCWFTTVSPSVSVASVTFVMVSCVTSVMLEFLWSLTRIVPPCMDQSQVVASTRSFQKRRCLVETEIVRRPGQYVRLVPVCASAGLRAQAEPCRDWSCQYDLEGLVEENGSMHGTRRCCWWGFPWHWLHHAVTVSLLPFWQTMALFLKMFVLVCKAFGPQRKQLCNTSVVSVSYWVHNILAIYSCKISVAIVVYYLTAHWFSLE